jgi:7-cyano-7-deazaguanine synthase in queuosine biosynthesis
MYDDILLDIDRILSSYKRMGILISGGFDSTLLSYLLHAGRDRLDTKNTFEFFVIPRYDDSLVHATRIAKYIDTKFNKTDTVINIVGNPDLHHSEQIRSGVVDAVRRTDMDLLLTADTANPEHLPDGPIRMKSPNRRYYKPFINHTKDKIVGLGIQLNLTDIMEISHTCTESKMFRCKNCWQCRERFWAFQQNRYVDPGKM